MRDYIYREKWHELLTLEIVTKLTLIHEYKREQKLFIETHKDELNELEEIAKVQSTEASNRIEGILTADNRLKKLVQAKMSRLLTLLLLYQSGFLAGKYICIEKVTEETKEIYYEAIQDSLINWHENKNDYKPFINYMLGVIVNVYKEFESRGRLLANPALSKAGRI